MSSVHSRAISGARASAASRQQDLHKERFSLENEMPKVFKVCLRLLDSSTHSPEGIATLAALRDDLQMREVRGVWFSTTTHQLYKSLNAFLRRH